MWGWRDSSEVKCICCFCREPRFSSQQSDGGSQPGDLTPSYDLCGQQTCTQCTYIPEGKTFMHIKVNPKESNFKEVVFKGKKIFFLSGRESPNAKESNALGHPRETGRGGLQQSPPQQEVLAVGALLQFRLVEPHRSPISLWMSPASR